METVAAREAYSRVECGWSVTVNMAGQFRSVYILTRFQRLDIRSVTYICKNEKNLKKKKKKEIPVS